MLRKWSSVFAVVVAAMICTTALADANSAVTRILPNPTAPVGTPAFVGVITSGSGAANGGGNIAYQGQGDVGFGIFWPDPGELWADDVNITEAGAVGQAIIQYSFMAGGYSDCDGDDTTGTLWDMDTALWDLTDGTEPGVWWPVMRPGQPRDAIPGTGCSFVGLPAAGGAGTAFIAVCDISANAVPLPASFFVFTHPIHSEDCAGPYFAAGAPLNGASSGRFRSTIACTYDPLDPGGPADCLNLGIPVVCDDDGALPQNYNSIGGIGMACHFEYPPDNQLDWLFSGFSPPFDQIGNWAELQVIVEGQPWACCDGATGDCTNVQESECANVFTQGTLCNDLPDLCSEAGACCDAATGECRDTFARLCDGYLESFIGGGATCATITTCVEPDNVPTLTQWGMVALTVLLLTGLTIKFGRRRTVTA